MALPLPLRQRRTTQRLRRVRAFSLFEALIALTITALAGSVLLLAVESSLQTTTDAVGATIADGIAQQIIDEICTERYYSDGSDPINGPLGATVTELIGPGRSQFDDADDYRNYSVQPPTDSFGRTLGTGDDAGNLRAANFRLRSDYFQDWRARSNAYFVDPSDHTITSASPTAFRAIEVFVERLDSNGAAHVLGHRKRIIAYIPPPP
jgi:hypothetical protein